MLAFSAPDSSLYISCTVPLDRRAGRVYLTLRLLNQSVKYEHGARRSQQYFLGPRRSHASRDPCAARAWRNLGVGAGQAVRHEPAGDLEAPQSARAREAHHAWPRGAVAPLPDRARSAEERRRMARELSPLLGGTVRSARGLPARAAGAGGN